MKYILFIIIIQFNTLSAQIIDTLDSVPMDSLNIPSFYKKTILTHQDSIMIDSIDKMLKVKTKLDSTIISLKNSNYSDNLKKVAYEKYITSIDIRLESQIEFIINNFKEYELFGKTHDSGRINNEKYIISSLFFHKVIGKYIIEKDKLKNCNLLKPIERKKATQIYKLQQKNIINLINTLIYDYKSEIQKERNPNHNKCYNENIKLLFNDSNFESQR